MGNIVWLASYPKSGNTWMRAFIYNLIEQPDRPGRISAFPLYFEEESKPRWYEPYTNGKPLDSLSFEEIFALRNTVHRDIADSVPRGSVFTKTHNFFGQFDGHPLHNISVMAGAIYMVRNPLDTVLSVADHFGLSVDEAIEFMANEQTGSPTNEENVAGMFGSWSTHVSSWTAQPNPNVVVLRYEDMLDKPMKAFSAVAKFLGIKNEPQRIRKAVQYSSFAELKKQEQKEGFEERSPNSRMFFRKGRKNQWPELLSDNQIQRIVDRHREQMACFKYIPPRFK